MTNFQPFQPSSEKCWTLIYNVATTAHTTEFQPFQPSSETCWCRAPSLWRRPLSASVCWCSAGSWLPCSLVPAPELGQSLQLLPCSRSVPSETKNWGVWWIREHGYAKPPQTYNTHRGKQGQRKTGMGSEDTQWQSARIMIKRSQVWVLVGPAGNLSSQVWVLPPGRTSRQMFFSRINFLCWLLFRYPFHPHGKTVACKKFLVILPKAQVTVKHTCLLCMWLWIKWHCKLVHPAQLAPRRQQLHAAPAM